MQIFLMHRFYKKILHKSKFLHKKLIMRRKASEQKINRACALVQCQSRRLLSRSMSGPTITPVDIMKFPTTLFAALCVIAYASAFSGTCMLRASRLLFFSFFPCLHWSVSSEMELGTCMCGLVSACRNSCTSTEQACMAACTPNSPKQQECITACAAQVQPCMTKPVTCDATCGNCPTCVTGCAQAMQSCAKPCESKSYVLY